MYFNYNFGAQIHYWLPRSALDHQSSFKLLISKYRQNRTKILISDYCCAKLNKSNWTAQLVLYLQKSVVVVCLSVCSLCQILCL